MGFQVDAGGEPIVIFPMAMAAARQALGIQSMKGVAITHIHKDHVRSLVELVRSQQIRPENIHYPEAFAVSPGAPGSEFAQALQQMQSDPALSAIGHGATSNYGVIRTPAAGNFFHITQAESDVTFDYYGLTQAFRDLQSQRQRGQAQRSADTASLLTRVTDSRTGYRVVYLGDLRGSDLELFRQAMGEASYNELLTGVRGVIGFQHHMGALKDPADRTGLVNFLRATYLKTGELNVFAQSEETYAGRQFLNRSLIEGLRQSGINVYVARGPQGGQAGTLTFTPGAGVTTSGGLLESFLGDPTMKGEAMRLALLQRAEEILTKYERFVKEEYRYTQRVKDARKALGDAWKEYLEQTMENVATTGAGRAQPTVGNPATRQQALNKVKTVHPVEELLIPAYIHALERLNSEGPFRETYEKAKEEALRTGKMPDYGIEALWEFEPEVARMLVGESNLPRSEQRKTLEKLPGQAMPVGARVGAGVMLAIQIAIEIAPLIQIAQARAFDEDVRKSLLDIMWWQGKGIFPSMQGAIKHYFTKNESNITDPKRIQELLDKKELDYLALTDIGAGQAGQTGNWDRFAAWSGTHLKNYKDWYLFITNTEAIKGEGGNIEEMKWSYRRAKIEDTWSGLSRTEEYKPSEQLTKILQTAAKTMIEGTEQQLGHIAKGPGPMGTAYRPADQYSSRDIYEDKPQATTIKRFKPTVKEPKLYTIRDQRTRTGYPSDCVFFVFPNRAAGEAVPAGYVVVGGADYNTYMYIYNTQNIVTQSGIPMPMEPNQLEALLAKETDLEDSK